MGICSFREETWLVNFSWLWPISAFCVVTVVPIPQTPASPQAAMMFLEWLAGAKMGNKHLVLQVLKTDCCFDDLGLGALVGWHCLKSSWPRYPPGNLKEHFFPLNLSYFLLFGSLTFKDLDISKQPHILRHLESYYVCPWKEADPEKTWEDLWLSTQTNTQGRDTLQLSKRQQPPKKGKSWFPELTHHKIKMPSFQWKKNHKAYTETGTSDPFKGTNWQKTSLRKSRCWAVHKDFEMTILKIKELIEDTNEDRKSCSRLILCIFYPRPRISPFSKEH